MSEFGVGPEDWLEVDLDELNRDRRGRILDLVQQHRITLEAMLGHVFEAVVRDDGVIGLIVNGDVVATVNRSVDDRLEVTRIDPERPYL